VALTPGVNLFMFVLTFVTNTANRTGCIGCSDNVVIRWNSATLFSRSQPDLVLVGSDKGTSCVAVNGASSTSCEIVPTRATTWGSLKAIYR